MPHPGRSRPRRVVAEPPPVPGRADAPEAARRGRPSTPGRGVRASALRSLVEDSEDGMILADEHGKILFANSATERFLGYAPAELVGRIGFDLCRPEHLPLAREAFGQCLAHPGVPVAFDVDVTRRDGGFTTLGVKLVNRLPAPGTRAVVVHFRDAAAPPRVDVDGEDPGEQYRALFYHAPIGLGVAALDGTLLTFNDAILQPGGYTREDIARLGNVARLYCHAAERDQVLALARAQGFVWREEVQFVRKDGTCYDALLSLTPVTFGGQQCWYAAVEDITDLKRAEEQRRLLEARLQQAQKMEAVGTMTAGIAHDFRNLLAVILANADLIAVELEGEQSGAETDLAELRAAAQRGSAMVAKLLAYSRQAEVTLASTDLSAVMQGMTAMARRLVPQNVRLDVQVSPGAVALVDASTVEQIVLNLVTNACDAMPGGGALVIDVRPITLRVEDVRTEWMRPGAFARISVADSGVGMDDETREKVFQPFFTTKPAGAGTGLGLAMVYGLVKQQSGFVDVQSRLGEGTTVSLYFPLGGDVVTRHH